MVGTVHFDWIVCSLNFEEQQLSDKSMKRGSAHNNHGTNYNYMNLFEETITVKWKKK